MYILQDYDNAKNHEDWRPQPELGMAVRQEPVRKPTFAERLKTERGRIGYVLAWLLGVPAWILLVVFFIRGH